MASVKIANVFKYYYSGKKLINAVNNFNLEINNGELVSILGPSGCGKSSLMRMIAGLEQITMGDIFIDSRNVTNLSPAERNVALAFESYALYQHFTVKNNISFCLETKKVPKDNINERVKNISQLLGIENILDVKPSSLSGGQQQLISLARALVRNPSVTLLDEPISHLDTSSRLKMAQKIRLIHSDTGLTMIYVTHNQEEALAIADKIAVMDNGELQQVGTRTEILEKPKNIFVANFVGEPPMNLINCKIVSGSKGVYKAVTEDKLFEAELTENVVSELKGLNLEDIIVGIRPVDIFEKEGKNINKKITGNIIYSEFLGETSIVKINFGENNILAVLDPSTDFIRGSVFDLFYNKEKIHFFNPKNQQRIDNK